MIELRWAHQHRGYIEKEKVLQYRTQGPVLIQRYVNGPWEHCGHDWGAWQDVPLVEVSNESPAAAPGQSKGEK